MTGIPVMRLGTTLLTALSDDTDDSAARDLMARVLGEAQRSRTCGVAIDVSSLEVVYPAMGAIVSDIAGCVGALDVRAFLCGASPQVAEALAEYGVDPRSVTYTVDIVEAIKQLEDV